MMDLIFHTPGAEPAPLLVFWRERAAAQDPALRLTWSPEWFRMMAENGVGASMVAELRDDGGAMRAVLPVTIREWRLRVTLAGRNCFTRSVTAAKVSGGDLLEDGLTAAQLAWMWDGFTRRHPEVQAFWLDHVRCGHRLDLIQASCEQNRRFAVHSLYGKSPHYRRRLHRTESRSKKSLDRLRSKERALIREFGKVQMVEIRQPADWRPYEQAIDRFMGSTWQARILGHTLRMADQQRVAERGWLRSFLLRAGDRVVAFVLCYEGEGTLVYEQLGYDESLSRYSPGTLLLHRVVDRLEQEVSLDYLDFGEGEAEYKKAMANEVVPTTGILVIRKSAALAVQLGLAGAAAGMDRVIRSIVRQAGLMSRLKRRWGANV